MSRTLDELVKEYDAFGNDDDKDIEAWCNGLDVEEALLISQLLMDRLVHHAAATEQQVALVRDITAAIQDAAKTARKLQKMDTEIRKEK